MPKSAPQHEFLAEPLYGRGQHVDDRVRNKAPSTTHVGKRLQVGGGRDPQRLERNLPALVVVFQHIRRSPPV